MFHGVSPTSVFDDISYHGYYDRVFLFKRIHFGHDIFLNVSIKSECAGKKKFIPLFAGILRSEIVVYRKGRDE